MRKSQYGKTSAPPAAEKGPQGYFRVYELMRPKEATEKAARNLSPAELGG